MVVGGGGGVNYGPSFTEFWLHNGGKIARNGIAQYAQCSSAVWL